MHVLCRSPETSVQRVIQSGGLHRWNYFPLGLWNADWLSEKSSQGNHANLEDVPHKVQDEGWRVRNRVYSLSERMEKILS